MLLGRLSNTAVAIPSLLIACAFALCADSDARAQDPSALCQDEAEVALLFSPIAPWNGAPLRVIFTVEKPADGELALIAPDGKVAAKSDQRLGGPPYFWFAEIASPAVGNWQAKLTRVNSSPQCREVTRDIAVQRKPAAKLRAAKGVWPLRDAWTRETENYTPHGSRSYSMRRLTRSYRGSQWTRCCMIRRAIFSSIISACARTRWGRSSNPTARMFRMSYARISPSRWDCHSVTRNARAATGV